MIRSLLATSLSCLLLLCALSSCRFMARGIDLPLPQEEAGVQLNVREMTRLTTKATGVLGTVFNGSGEAVACRLRFEAIGEWAEHLAWARTGTARIEPGQTWSFNARFDRPNVRLVGSILLEDFVVEPAEPKKP